MSLKSSKWNNAKDIKDTILILYSCSSACAKGQNISLGYKISNLHKNITVVAFDGFIRYGDYFSGNIESVNKVYHSQDGKGETVIYRGVEIYRNYFRNPWLPWGLNN